jgi:hypothetical protein
MPPRPLVHLLGLCNLVAGALLAFDAALVAPVDGAGTPAARLLGASGGALLAAIAVGAWRMPQDAVRPYLWTFGVGVKLAAAAVWAAAAVVTAVPALLLGASLDLGIAVAIAAGLRRSG